jgi:hypothetical protein
MGCGFGSSGSWGPASCSSCRSQSQQSLHAPHFSQRWFAQVSLVHLTQIRVDCSSQILQINGITLVIVACDSFATVRRAGTAIGGYGTTN